MRYGAFDRRRRFRTNHRLPVFFVAFVLALRVMLRPIRGSILFSFYATKQ